MKKIEIIREVANQTGVEKAVVETILESFMASVKEHTVNKEYVALSGFGRFGLKKRAAKVGRNILKNVPLHVEAHYIPAFRPSRKFVQRVKQAVK